MSEITYIFTSKRDDNSDIEIIAHTLSELSKKISIERNNSTLIRESESHLVIMIDEKPSVINLMINNKGEINV
jgi:uncharacterized protein YjiK